MKKQQIKQRVIGVSLAFASLIGFVADSGAQVPVTIDWNDTHQRIDGFGACSAWMSSITDAQADAFFSTNGLGIGLSLLRARIAPGGTSWDTSIMQKAQARGARIWSAPWSPAAEFKTNNQENYGGFVIRSKYQEYANQLANYVLNLKNSYGVNLYAISINNEPTARPPFESCQWTAQQMHDFVPYLHNAMVSKGVGSTKIMLPENQTWDVTLANKTMYDPVTAGMIGIIAAHDYAGAGPGPLNSWGKPLWQTERATDDLKDGIMVTVEIHEHMVLSDANAWHTWWLDADEGGLMINGVPTKQMYAMGQFSRFIRPDYYRVGTTSSGGALISAYKDWQSTRFTIVAVNTSTNSIAHTFTLSGANTVTTVTPWITSASLSLSKQSVVAVTGQSFNYTIPAGSVVTFIGQTHIVPGPTATPIPAQTTYKNSATEAIPFTVSDPSATITASSTNPGLVPNTAFTFGGSGASRMLAIAPATNQTGTATINLVVNNSAGSATIPFVLNVLPPPVPLPPATAVTTGPITDPATWGVALPVVGDFNIWRSGAKTLKMATSPETFNGGTLVIQAGGSFAPGRAAAGLTLNQLVLDGGTIQMANNLGLIMNLSGKPFTLNSGTLKTGSGSSMNIVIENSSLEGSGTIQITGASTNGSQVQFQTSNYTTNFTGIFSIQQNGLLDLPPIAIDEASFGLNISGTGKYNNEFEVALTSLVIDGTAIPPGTYAYADFTPAQRTFLKKSSGIITVVAPSHTSDPIISTVADQTTRVGTPTPAIPFTVSGGADVNALVVSGFSLNQTLVPDGNFLFGGSGSNRTVVITPAPNQTGTAGIRLVVSDGARSATNLFSLAVTPMPRTITAVANGALSGATTWSEAAPLPGDGNIWQSGTHTLDMKDGATQTFHGETLVLQSGGQLVPGIATANLTLNNLVLDGGTIYMGNNIGLNIDLRQHAFTMNSGTLQAGIGSRDVRFLNGSLAGSGTINISGKVADGAKVTFQDTITTTDFTGLFNVMSYGILNLPAVSSASFGITIAGTGKYWNDAAVSVTSLTIAGHSFVAGTYTYASIGAAYQSYLGNNGGSITVTQGPDRYSQWAAAYGIPGEDRTGDSDGDGLSNVYEYGLGGNPTNRADLGHVPTLGTESNWLKYVHVERSAANSGVTYTVEVADELVAPNWGTNGIEFVGTGVLDAEFNTVTNRISTQIKTNQFIRLIIK